MLHSRTTVCIPFDPESLQESDRLTRPLAEAVRGVGMDSENPRSHASIVPRNLAGSVTVNEQGAACA